MKKEHVRAIALFGIGIVSMVFGNVVAKREEKRWEEEYKAREEEHEYLTKYAEALGMATEQYRTEVDKMGDLADAVLKHIEESEKEFDEEEEEL